MLLAEMSEIDYDPQKSSLFVNNIDSKVTKQELNDFFGQYGTISGITLEPWENYSNYSNAYINYNNEENAHMALKNTQYAKLKQNELIVMYASDRHNLKREGKIFVKNVHPEVTAHDLHEVFSNISSELYAQIKPSGDQHKNNSACVHFFDPENVEKAINELQGTELKGEKLSLERWKYKDEPHHGDRKVLYVQDLPKIDETELLNEIEDLFKTFGEIEKTTLKLSAKYGSYLAIIGYKNAEDANKAFQELSSEKKTLKNSKKPLIVEWFKTKDERLNELVQKHNQIYLRNIKPSMTEGIIEAIFSKIAPVESVDLKPRQKGNKTMSYHAIITFQNGEDAEIVMAKGPKTKVVLDLFLSLNQVDMNYFRPNIVEKQQKTSNKPIKSHTVRNLPPNESLAQAQQVKILAKEVVLQPSLPFYQNNGFPPLMQSQLFNFNQQYSSPQNYFANRLNPYAPNFVSNFNVGMPNKKPAPKKENNKNYVNQKVFAPKPAVEEKKEVTNISYSVSQDAESEQSSINKDTIAPSALKKEKTKLIKEIWGAQNNQKETKVNKW